MRGIASANFPAFDYAAEKLRSEGFEVWSPADNDRRLCNWSPDHVPSDDEIADMVQRGVLSVRMCFSHDTHWLCNCADAVAVLPGATASLGVQAEVALARALGLTIIFLGGDYAPPKNSTSGSAV